MSRKVPLSKIRAKFDQDQEYIIQQRPLDIDRSVDEIEDMIYHCPELDGYNRAEMVRLVRNQLYYLGNTGMPDKDSIDRIKMASPIIDDI